MSLSPEISNVAPVPFVAMALQTAEQINDAYMRKMNRDYAAHIPDSFRTSFANSTVPTTFNESIHLE